MIPVGLGRENSGFNQVLAMFEEAPGQNNGLQASNSWTAPAGGEGRERITCI